MSFLWDSRDFWDDGIRAGVEGAGGRELVVGLVSGKARLGLVSARPGLQYIHLLVSLFPHLRYSQATDELSDRISLQPRTQHQFRHKGSRGRRPERHCPVSSFHLVLRKISSSIARAPRSLYTSSVWQIRSVASRKRETEDLGWRYHLRVFCGPCTNQKWDLSAALCCPTRAP